MVGFVIPMPEGSNPGGKGLDAGPTARLLASAEAGRHAVERSGSLASDAKQGCPDIDAKLVCRRGVGASCRDHEEVIRLLIHVHARRAACRLPEPARHTSPGMDETSQVPRKELLHVHKVSDCARVFPWKPVRHGMMLPSLQRNEIGTSELDPFRSSILGPWSPL